jgi:hypothetical protein
MRGPQFFRGMVVLLGLGAASAAQAQPVITSPSSGQIFRAGPDFASDVLQDPWDFSNVEDVSPNPDEVGGWASPTPSAWRTYGTGPAFVNTAAGRFSAQGAGDAQLMLLARPDATAINPGRSGARFPIDTAQYRKLAIKMRVTNAPAGEQLVAYWSHDGYTAPNYLNRGGGIAFPGTIPSGTSEQVYVFDLTQAGTGGSVLIPSCAGSGCTGTPAPWTNEALVKGLRIDPISAAALQGVEIDWVRLTASNASPSAALMTVNLASCSAFNSLAVTDSAGVTYTVTDSSGNNSQRSFNYGVLPPGAYTLRVSCGNGTSSGTPFTVNAPPAVTVIDPDETGAPDTDYAALNRGGDRWDFQEATDIARIFNVSVTQGACAGGGCGLIPSDRPGAAPGSLMLRASSAGAVGDPAFEFLNGAIPPLSGRRHQYLTFSLRILRPYDLAVGSMARVMWGSQTYADGTSITESQDMRVWPGFNTYTIDLASLTAQNGGIETECLPNCPTTPWPARSLRFFRIDPFEFGDQPTAFDIDDVTLTAPDEVALGQQFAVRYAFTDADTAGSSYVARVYAETYPQRTGRTLLGAINGVGPNAVLSYNFDPAASGIGPGRYSIYVEVTETRAGVQQVSGAYATGPIVVYSLTGSNPQISVSSPAPGQLVPFPFTITGCAYDAGNAAGVNMDDLAVYAIAGSGVVNTPAGTVRALGFGLGSGTLQYAPLTGTDIRCDGISDPLSPYHKSGFRIVDAALEQGPWILRMFARSTITGKLTGIGDIPFQVTQLTLAPQNFQATVNGNAVTVSFDAPSGGPPVGGYAIDAAFNPGFNPAAFTVVVPSAGSYSGSIANGTYYLRIRSLAPNGAPGMASETRTVSVGSAPVTPPGAPALRLTQSSNPVALAWSPGSGGTPTTYTIYAGTSPGASNLAVASVGMSQSISAMAPVGLTIYVRVVASNAAGSATSNEVAFAVSAPAAPGAPTLSPASVNGGVVSLAWAPPASGGAPTGYVVLARLPGSPAVIASLPVGGTSVSAAAPPGTYVVSIQAVNGAGASPESNQITVVVP